MQSAEAAPEGGLWGSALRGAPGPGSAPPRPKSCPNQVLVGAAPAELCVPPSPGQCGAGGERPPLRRRPRASPGQKQ